MSIADINDRVNSVQPMQRDLPAAPLSTLSAALFNVVPLTGLGRAHSVAPAYWWEGYLPVGVVTLLGAHGGTGKSTVSLMLGVCIALRLPLFGIPTRQGKVVFFSGEDGAELVRYRLSWICDKLGIDPAELQGRLHILDATEGEPVLFHEIGIGGKRQGLTTPSYDALRQYLDDHQINVLIVDNASDAFDASEIDRARVRGFMRSLLRIAQDGARAVLLLAHVDKGTSRGDRGPNSEGYSGSTAWHNSARSRLYLSRNKDGGLLLEHQKHNLGKLAEPLRLIWPDGDIPQTDAPLSGVVQHIAGSVDTKALLKLIHEFTERGEFVSPGSTSRTNACKLLSRERTYPKLKDAEVADLLRQAERKGWLTKLEYRGTDRHPRERWEVSPTGRELAGIAGTAGTAGTSDVPAPSEVAAEPAGTAGTSARGYGGIARRTEAPANQPVGAP